MKLAAWLEKIQKLHPVKWDLGLDRVGEVGRRMQVLKPAKTVFMIAGTNGKGSTCEVLSRLCTELDLDVGKTTSPFLIDYNEQIEVNGQPVSDEVIAAAFERIDRARADISLTYFEFGALAALDIFSGLALDVAILEVGLGGRLDAMNIVDADISIITKIDVDHQAWLGNDRETIAREKAGILRESRPCIFVDPDPPRSLFEAAVAKGAICFCLGRDFHLSQGILRQGQHEFLLHNCSLPEPSAVAAIQGMLAAGYKLNQQLLDRALSRASLPGRYQVLRHQGRTTILDVAHNPGAARYLLEKLRQDGVKTTRAVVGMYADKDITSVFQILSPVISDWYLCELDRDRAAPSGQLLRTLSDSCGLSGRTYDKVAHAYKSANADAKSDDVILVFGSFPVVAGVLRYLERPGN